MRAITCFHLANRRQIKHCVITSSTSPQCSIVAWCRSQAALSISVADNRISVSMHWPHRWTRLQRLLVTVTRVGRGEARQSPCSSWHVARNAILCWWSLKPPTMFISTVPHAVWCTGRPPRLTGKLFDVRREEAAGVDYNSRRDSAASRRERWSSLFTQFNQR